MYHVFICYCSQPLFISGLLKKKKENQTIPIKMPLRWGVHTYTKCRREGSVCFNILQLAVNTCQNLNWQIMWFGATKQNSTLGWLPQGRIKERAKKLVAFHKSSLAFRCYWCEYLASKQYRLWNNYSKLNYGACISSIGPCSGHKWIQQINVPQIKPFPLLTCQI